MGAGNSAIAHCDLGQSIVQIIARTLLGWTLFSGIRLPIPPAQEHIRIAALRTISALASISNLDIYLLYKALLLYIMLPNLNRLLYLPAIR